MNRKTIGNFLASLLLVLGTSLALAEDIDIYSSNTTITPAAPNVLIVMDNTANWSQSFASGTKFAAEKTALAAVVSALNTQFKLGLMLFTETGGSNSTTDGGYVRFAIQAMTDSSGNATAARNCLLKMVGSGTTCTSTNAYYSNLDINNDKSNGGKSGVTMGEAYDYFAGVNAYAGNNKVKADPLAFTSGTIAGPTYNSPVSANSCEKNFIIVISNGPFQDNSSDTATATSQLSTAGGNTTVINPPDNGSSQNNEADEWTRFLNKSTVNAITYTLEVGPSTTGQGPYNTALLQSMGRQGKGGYYSAIDAATLLAALTRIFNDIQSVNSVFASVSLPLSADNTGSFSDQVYMGVFRPDGQGNPRWVGNLKQYKFAADANQNLSLVDRNGLAAAGSKGFATPDAVSFWTTVDTSKAPDATYAASTSSTTGSTGGFWFFDSKGSGGNYDSPDGEWVEKGGAAQQLRLAYLGYGNRGGIGDTNASTLNSLPARKVYTCTGTCATGSSLSATPFDTSNTNITAALLGTAEATVTSLTSAASKSVSVLWGGTSVTIVSVDRSTGIVTTAGHSFVIGDTVNIAGNSSNPVNGGPYTVTAVTSITFTITGLSGNGTGTGGTATKPTTTATATSTAHGFVVGQRITIAGATPSAFNGVVTVVSVPNANTFTYTMASPLGQSATGTITATSNTATAVAAAHGLSTGQAVTIAGATPSGYNGVYGVTVIDANTFTYVYAVAAPLASATGTITASIGGGRTTLIKWVRGQDTQDENGFKVNGADTDVRASIHGDILHSRPVVLNYGTTSDNVYIFYGGNDGVFRAVKGGQANTDGNEQWAFIPQEFFGKFKRLYDNNPTVLYPSTPASLTPTPTGTCDPTTTTCAAKRDYFWDGPVGSYIERDSGGAISKAYLYIGARRGGRFIYALDVTSPTAPKFLWKKGCTTSGSTTTCDTGFDELGQTWSLSQGQVQLQTGFMELQAAVRIKAHTNPVLIFGGGYDATSEDAEPPAASDTMGRAVYVVDAFDGSIVWWAGNSAHSPTLSVSGMNFSVAADMLLMDRLQTGYVDRVYAADVGGNLWRLDIGDALTSNWNVWKIASVGNRSATASTRKFLFSPDVVFGEQGTFDAIVIGSGDREHPLAGSTANGVVNRVYMFKDPHTGTTGASLNLTESDLFDATNSSTVPADANGWFVTLASGEKVINGPIIVASDVFFGTNQPDTSNLSCTGNLGIARRYDINYLTGAASGFTDSSGNAVRSEEAVGGGFLPSTVAGNVNIGGLTYTFLTDNPLNPGGVRNPHITVPTKRFRTWWREVLE